jgi:hypothetical protein
MKVRTELRNAARDVAARARHEAARRFVEIRDEMLVEAGKAAEARQHRRARTRVLKKAAAVVAVAGAGAAAVLATRAAMRRQRGRRG